MEGDSLVTSDVIDSWEQGLEWEPPFVGLDGK